jgi:hypothetical protein
MSFSQQPTTGLHPEPDGSNLHPGTWRIFTQISPKTILNSGHKFCGIKLSTHRFLAFSRHCNWSTQLCSGLGGVVVSVLATGPSLRVRTRPRWWIFMGDNNPQHTFPSDGKWSRKVPCRKILRHVKELLKSDRDEQAKFSFPSPISYCSRGVYDDGQSALVVKLGVSPSRSRLLTGLHSLSSGDSITGPRPQCWDSSLTPTQHPVYQSTQMCS